MPKKAHGRPAKTRNRVRRPAARPAASDVGLAPAGQDLLAERVPVTTAGPTFHAARPAVAAPTVRRGASTARRAPATVINYHYLRRDITTLSVLAPAMVVVLIILFFLLHY